MNYKMFDEVLGKGLGGAMAFTPWADFPLVPGGAGPASSVGNSGVKYWLTQQGHLHSE
jgi:hypothetical protein